MKTLRMIATIIITICVINVISSCKNEADEPNGQRTLVDKKDSVFLDNGKYIAATTEFTDEEAINILKSSVWVVSSDYYIYDYTKIVKNIDLSSESYYIGFEDNGIFRKSYWLDELYGGPEFEYSVKNKVLKLHEFYRDQLGTIYSEYKTSYKLVAVDKDRIIMDIDKISVVDLLLFPDINKEQAVIRNVWKAMK